MNFKMVVCGILDHSRIITTFFGYQYCGRCGEQIGDTLMGVGIGLAVVIGHNCEECQKNYKLMSWRDKFFVPHPFTGPIVAIEEQRKKLRESLKAETK